MHIIFNEMPFISFIVIVNFFSSNKLVCLNASFYKLLLWLARGVFFMTVLRRNGKVLWWILVPELDNHVCAGCDIVP